MTENLVAHSLELTSETKKHLMSGKAIFTIRNSATNNHYTFKIESYKQTYSRVFFMYDYLKFVYIGTITTARTHFKSKNYDGSMPNYVEAFNFFWSNLGVKTFPPNFELHHMGLCLKCGRPLTNPESISIGIGPICREGL